MTFMFDYITEIRSLDHVRAASRQRWQIATAIAAAAMIDLLIEAHFHIMYIASVIRCDNIPSVTLLQHVCPVVKRKNEPELVQVVIARAAYWIAQSFICTEKKSFHEI